MGVSRMTVHSVRWKKRPATTRFLAKLETARRRLDIGKLGLPVSASWDDNLLLFAVRADYSGQETDLAPDEIFARTQEGEGTPAVVKLLHPSIGTGLKVICKALAENNCDHLLKACLPLPYDASEWIERLSAPSYLHAIKKCVALVLGPDWQKDLAMIIRATEQQHAGAHQVYPGSAKTDDTAKPEE
jgi:hypothetical protein